VRAGYPKLEDAGEGGMWGFDFPLVSRGFEIPVFDERLGNLTQES
jgi:hypothetical protein